MPCGCCQTKNDLRRFCCLPLAAVVLVVAVCIVIYQSWLMSETLRGSLWPNGYTITSLVIQLIQCLIGVIGIIAVLVRWITGVSILQVGMHFVLLALVFSLIASWVVFFLDITGKNESREKLRPNATTIATIVCETLISCLFFVLAWWIFGCVKSLKAVMGVGGTGWEFKNYRELRTGGNKRVLTSSDSDV